MEIRQILWILKIEKKKEREDIEIEMKNIICAT